MTAFNAVRFRVKPGREDEFLDAHKKIERNWAGLQHVADDQRAGAIFAPAINTVIGIN